MGIQFLEFQSFPINCLSIECLDSRLRGNDEPIRTETCTTSFPRKWESSFLSFSHFQINCLSIECLDSRLRGNDGF
ncbi:hypothetical protein EJF87_12770 [Neisseria meningitidis]|nr:hypothetical protein [Neisseria meningitidis]